MENDPKYVTSRRDFIQLAAAGALITFSPLRSDGQQAGPDGSALGRHPNTDSALSSRNQAIAATAGHECVYVLSAAKRVLLPIKRGNAKLEVRSLSMRRQTSLQSAHRLSAV